MSDVARVARRKQFDFGGYVVGVIAAACRLADVSMMQIPWNSRVGEVDFFHSKWFLGRKSMEILVIFMRRRPYSDAALGPLFRSVLSVARSCGAVRRGGLRGRLLDGVGPSAKFEVDFENEIRVLIA